MALKPKELEWIQQFFDGEDTSSLESPAPDVERFGPGTGTELTSPYRSIRPYGEQGPALRDPNFPTTGAGSRQGQMSTDEHVEPFAIDKMTTRNPATGESPLEVQKVKNGQPVFKKDGSPRMVDGPARDAMPTVRTPTTTADLKTEADMAVINDAKAAERAARASKGSFDPYEDLTPAQKSAMTPQAAIEREMSAVAQAQDPVTTRADATIATHGQEGVKADASRAGHADHLAELSKDLDVDSFVENNKFASAPDYLDPILPGLDEHGKLPPSTPEAAGPAAPAPADPAPAEPVSAKPAPAEPIPAEPVPSEPVPAKPVPTEPVPVEPLATAEPAVPVEGAAGAEAGAGGLARSGFIGAGIAAGMQVVHDWGKVTSGEMSVGDAAKDVGKTAGTVGGLTIAGEAAAKTLVSGASSEAGALAAGAEAGAAGAASSVANVVAKGGVIGAVVAGGIALIDDVGKVKSGKMTGGTATVDVAAKAAVGVGAGMAGAWAGAAVGSAVPVVGTAIGFVVGGAVGYVGSKLVESETGQAVIHEAGKVVDGAIDGVEAAGKAVAKEAGAAVDKVEEVAAEAKHAVAETAGKAADAVENAASNAWDKVTSLF